MPRRGTRHRQKPDAEAKQLGAWVRQLRQKLDYTFDAFVEELGMGRGYLSELERGLVVPSLHTLTRLAKALELTVADLVAQNSSRETLFSLTRGMPESDIRQLLQLASRLRRGVVAKPSGEPFSAVVGNTEQRYRIALPLLAIKPAAGAWSELQEPGDERWIQPLATVPIRKGLLVAQVDGRSMEPTISDKAFCVFRRPWSPAPGEMGIFTRSDAGDPEHMARYTLKIYDPVAEQESQRISGSLKPRNPAFAPLHDDESNEGRERPFAQFLFALE